jgi:hypothetical protein
VRTNVVAFISLIAFLAVAFPHVLLGHDCMGDCEHTTSVTTSHESESDNDSPVHAPLFEHGACLALHFSVVSEPAFVIGVEDLFGKIVAIDRVSLPLVATTIDHPPKIV